MFFQEGVMWFRKEYKVKVMSLWLTHFSKITERKLIEEVYV